MFWFPKDEERCRKWVQNSRWDDLRTVPIQKLCHFQLCSKHFEDSQFMKARSVMSTIKKTSIKSIEQPFDILQDLPSTSKQSHVCDTPVWTSKVQDLQGNILSDIPIAFSNFVQTMETLFCSIFGGVMYQNDLLKTLCKTVEKDVTELHKCGITQCLHRLHQYVKLYMTKN